MSGSPRGTRGAVLASVVVVGLLAVGFGVGLAGADAPASGLAEEPSVGPTLADEQVENETATNESDRQADERSGDEEFDEPDRDSSGGFDEPDLNEFEDGSDEPDRNGSEEEFDEPDRDGSEEEFDEPGEERSDEQEFDEPDRERSDERESDEPDRSDRQSSNETADGTSGLNVSTHRQPPAANLSIVQTWVYQVPFSHNTQELPDDFRSELRVTPRFSGQVSVDIDADGSYERTESVSAGQTKVYDQPAPGSEVVTTVPANVSYRYRSDDYSAYEDGIKAYGAPESSVLGTEYYLPVNGDAAWIAAPTATNVRVDADGDGIFEQTRSVPADGAIEVTGVQASGHFVADDPIHVVVEGSRWSNADLTYAASLLPAGSAPTSYRVPAEPSYNRQSATSGTSVFLAGTQSNTQVDVDLDGDGAPDRQLTVDAGQVQRIQTTSSFRLSADAPIVPVYAYLVAADDPWTGDRREYLGVATPTPEIRFRQPSFQGISEHVGAWSTYNLSGSGGTGGGLDVTITQIDASDFPTIDVYATVTDNGSPVTGLSKSAFDVLEDGVGQTITSVTQLSQSGSDISTALVIDRSSSMGNDGKLTDARQAAKQFVDQFQPGDEGALVSFATDVQVDQRWTRNGATLKSAIDSLSSGGSTSLFDAALEGVRQAGPRTGRSAVILLADGESNSDTATKQDVINEAQSRNVPIYTIGLGVKNEQNLKDLARQTGGTYYRAPSSSDLSQIYQDISQQIRNEYRITYDTSNAVADGTTRLVKLIATAGGKQGSDTGQYTAPCAPLPTADFTFSTSGRGISVDASPSSPTSRIDSYEWDFDNDGVVDATGQQATYTYASTGTYELRLVVSKPCGASDVLVRTITVGGGGSAFFRVDSINAPASVAQGDSLTVSTTVTNTGTVTDTKPVTLTLGGKTITTGTGTVDVAFMIDTSTSMSEEIDSVRNGLTDFTNKLQSQGIDVRYAVVTFADQQPYNLRQRYTSDVSQTQQTLNNIPLTGATERSFDTIDGSIDDLDARSNAKEVFIVFTDEDSDTDSGTPSASQLSRRLESEDISLFAVTYPEGGSRIGDPSKSIGRVANLTANSQFFDIGEGNFATKFEQEISTAVLRATAGTPLTLAPGETDTLTFTIDGSTTATFPPGTYDLTVSTPDDSMRTTIDITGGSTGSGVTRSAPASVSSGGTATVTVTATMDSSGGAFALSEEFSGQVTGSSVTKVTVDGRDVTASASRQATDQGVVVALSSTGPGATVEVTYEVDAAASTGQIEITGRASTGTTATIGRDVIQVSSCSLSSFVQQYDADGNCAIDVNELGQAGLDFANGQISIAEYGDVAVAYANT